MRHSAFGIQYSSIPADINEDIKVTIHQHSIGGYLWTLAYLKKCKLSWA